MGNKCKTEGKKHSILTLVNIITFPEKKKFAKINPFITFEHVIYECIFSFLSM